MCSPECSKNCTNLIKAYLAFAFVFAGQVAMAIGPYTYNTDGSEVTDTITGLVWRRCNEGQTWSGSACTGTAVLLTHQATMERAATQTGWRLPNIKELSSLVNKSNINPAIDAVAFPGTVSSYYWSSSPYLGNTSNARIVDFRNGIVSSNYRGSPYYVRLVR